jgi:GxxExxY protein
MSVQTTEMIIGCAYTVANSLGPGFLEKVYETLLPMRCVKMDWELSSNMR